MNINKGQLLIALRNRRMFIEKDGLHPERIKEVTDIIDMVESWATPTSPESEALAEELAGPHLVCEDCWFSCPKSGECCNDKAGDECNCGRDRRVQRIAEAIAAVRADEQAKAAVACEEDRGPDQFGHVHQWLPTGTPHVYQCDCGAQKFGSHRLKPSTRQSGAFEST